MVRVTCLCGSILPAADPALPVRVCLTLLHFLWQGTLVALLVAGAGPVLRRATPAARCRVLVASLAAMAACPIVTFVLLGDLPAASVEAAPVATAPDVRKDAATPSASSTAQKPAAVPTAYAGPAYPSAAPAYVTPPPAAPRPTSVEAAPLPATPIAPASGITAATLFCREHVRPYAPAAAAAYLCGVVLMLVRTARALHGGKRLGRGASDVTDAALLAMFRRQGNRLGLRVLPRLATCARVVGPCVAGVVRPTILLPLSLATHLSPEQIEAVLAHDLAHVRRLDPLVNVLQQAIEAFLFFHPAVWVISARIRAEREHCCDDLAVSAGTEPTAYSQCLVRVAELARMGWAGATPAGALGATGRPSLLRRRIARLLDPASAGGERVLLARGPGALLVAAAALAVLAVRLLPSAAAPATAPATRPANAANAGPFDRFFYFRHNVKDGTFITDTLVLASILPDGFEQKEVFTENNLHIGFRPLCVANGKLYAKKIEELIEIDLATGEKRWVDSAVYNGSVRDKRLYALMPAHGEGSTIRIYDFEKGGVRDVMPVDGNAGRYSARQSAVSPDLKRMAWFTPADPAGGFVGQPRFQLRVADLDAKTVASPGPEIAFAEGMDGSLVPGAPPFVWLNDTTLLVVQTLGPDGKPPAQGQFATDQWLTTIEVANGKTANVVHLPREVGTGGPIAFGPVGSGSDLVLLAGSGAGRYKIDLVGGKVVAAETKEGAFGLSGSAGGGGWGNTALARKLTLGGQTLAEVTDRDGWLGASVSPDGRRVLWRGPAKAFQTVVRYDDADHPGVRTVAEGNPDEPFIWTTAADVTAPQAKAALPAGWEPLKYREWPKRDPQADPRPVLSDALTLTIAADHPRYKLHEPVGLTMTITNKGNVPVTLERPQLQRRSLDITWDYPGGGSKLVDQYWGSDQINPPDLVTLKPGEGVSNTEPLEPWVVGKHKITASIRAIATGNYRGGVETAPVSFTVDPADDPKEAKRLVNAKVERLVNRLRADFIHAPAWDGWTPSQDDLANIGPSGATPLLAALSIEQDPRFQARFHWPLIHMADPAALQNFLAWLKTGSEPERKAAVQGLFELYHQKTAAKDEALAGLTQALRSPDEATRTGAMRFLREAYDPRIRDAFEAVVLTGPDDVRTPAARYLAAAEWKDLRAWLVEAENHPTAARYAAGVSIATDLETNWHRKAPAPPDEPWTQAERDPAVLAAFAKSVQFWRQWADENPAAAGTFFDRDRQPWGPGARPTTEPAGK